MRWAIIALFLGIELFFGIAVNCTNAQEVNSSQTKSDETVSNIDDSKLWKDRRVAEFAAHEVVQLAPDGEVPARFEKNSLLNWSNPIRNAPAGAVFLWTVEGRPRLIASTYSYRDGIEQELSSLSEHAMALNQGKVGEHRFTPGIEWKEMPKVEPPHKQRTLRLVQMRRMAERFRVTIIAKETSDARLLTQPIYRTSAEDKVECAIFAFVQGTDPEAVLLIEAAETNAWRYAFARMTSVRVTADLDNERVCDLAWFHSSYLNDQPFHKIQYPGHK